MPQYAYTARDATGKQVEGTLSADSSALAVGKLREAKDTKKPVLMKVYREGSTRFVAISPRAA